jgi:CMP-N-acetylneuraminic acid synthetase
VTARGKEKPSTIGFVFARGGSKGVKFKNGRDLAGKPLIAHAIETARACPSIDRVVVSTDSEALAGIAREYGAEVPFMRPVELAQDNSPEWLAWRHAISELRRAGCDFDVMVSVPATAPLRTVEDVEGAISALDDSADLVVTGIDAPHNPYFNMVERAPDDTCRLVCRKEGGVIRRQEAPGVYVVVPVAYVTRPDFVMQRSSLFDGRLKLHLIPREHAVDIDEPIDFAFAEFLMRQRQAAARQMSTLAAVR